MRTYNLKAILKAALRVACLLPLAAASVLGQQQVNLTAGPTTATLPDGSVVPMWGYSCAGPTVISSSTATCAKLNPNAAGWSPVVITIPTGQSLTINLTNNLPVPPGATSGIPTSLTIVGQLGGGLGTTATSAPSPVHPPQGATWPIVSDNSGPTFNPPAQGNRVQSFSTEVLTGATTALTWASLRPGTYLIESGTHPSIQGPMGLYGILVVTTAPTVDSTTGTASPGTAYTGVTYGAEVPLLMSEIDPVQNNAVNNAVNTAGFVETATHNLKLADSVNSIAVTDGGAGYTSADTLTVNIAGGGTPTTVAKATATVDGDSTSPTYGQVISITVTNPGAGYTSNPSVTISGGTPTKVATAVSGLLLANSDPCANGVPACYPPAVNYTPLYYLFNGVAFDKTNAGGSLFNAVPVTSMAAVTGNVLVRFVNAGLRMHVPSIVGAQTGAASGFSLIAEDGNPLPGVRRVQSEVFMAAGKTYDVMINVPAAVGNALPVYDRELSLSGNAIARDAGMLAYIGINGAGLQTTGVFASTGATANPDSYSSVIAGKTLTVSDLSKGVIANDYNVSGVKIATAPMQGTLNLNANGTFTYSAYANWSAPDTFTYCGNGVTYVSPAPMPAQCAVVTLGAASVNLNGTAVSDKTFTSNVANFLSIKSPGILQGDTDAAGYPLTVAVAKVAPGATNGIGPCGSTVVAPCISVDKSGGFNAFAAPGIYTFTYQAQNSQGTLSALGGSGGTGNVGIATVTLNFPTGSGLAVSVVDGQDKTIQIKDYRWVIEEDRTFYVDPTNTTNTGAVLPTFGTNFHTSYMPLVATGCTGPLSCESGQTVLGKPAVCDVGNGACRTDATQETAVDPSQVVLDPSKRYYISVLPGDAANPFNNAYGGAPDCTATGVKAGHCGHGMGGAPIAAHINNGSPLQVLSQPTPNPPAKLTVFVFEDDYPLNGEHDAGGGIDVLSPNEPGLGGFQITLFDDAGGTGDATGQPTYDMFNMPLSNSLAGTIDPATGFDACPISVHAREGFDAPTGAPNSPTGISSMIVTCPKYEAGRDALGNPILSPLAGQAVVANLYAGRYGVVATPGADRIASGEEWLQTNTLDGQKAHDSFMRIGEPGYFQEFGPAGFHVNIGFANPKIINDRKAEFCGTAGSCTNEVKGHVTTARMSRTPDERLYGSGSHDSFAFTQCYASLGDPDGPDFAFAKCADDGSFDLTGIPSGNFKVTIFDQWNDQVVDGISTPVGLSGGAVLGSGSVTAAGSGYITAPAVTVSAPPCAPNYNTTTCIRAVAVATVDKGMVTGVTFTNFGAGYTAAPTLTIAAPPAAIGNTTATATASIGVDMGEVATHQWQANIYTRTFFDPNYSGVPSKDLTGVPCPSTNPAGLCNPNYGTDTSTGLSLVSTNIRFRDGSYSNFNNTDLSGNAGFNEIFPLFSWYTIETDSTRYKSTGTHVVYDAGGPTDGTTGGGSSNIGNYLANTVEPAAVALPPALRVPGAWYCSNADCTDAPSPLAAGGTGGSTGRIDPPFWFDSYGWQGFSGQNSFLEFGKKPFAEKENGGIHGHVVYASTRPFDDPQLLLQLSWEPLIPHVRINLYKEGVAPDGVTQSLTLIDHTETSSFDDWAQGFRHNANGSLVTDASGAIPNISCPGQLGDVKADPFYLGLQGQPNYLDWYNAQHNSPQTAATVLASNSQFKCYDGLHNWNQLQPAPYDGKYSFPSVTGIDPANGKPLGTNCTACATNPDTKDPYRSGAPMLPAGKYVVEVVVPPGYELVKEEDKNILIGDNYIAPVTQQFAGLGNIFIMPDQAAIGATYNGYNPQNPTTDMGSTTFPRHEGDTGSVEAFWPCVGASRIVPDYISLFPQSFEVAPFAGATRNLCDRKEVTLTDQSAALAKFYLFTPTHVAAHFTGVITDDFTAEFDPFSPQFGEKFAPPNLPVSIKDWTGNEIARTYADQWGAYNGLNYSTWEVNPPNPTGYGPTMMVVCMNDRGTGATPDPFYQESYSQFCYELPFMPGQTGYFDTPVVPTSAFAGAGYNNPDCNYADSTPAISEVDGDGVGPWVSAPGNPITIRALGDQTVNNNAYSGPSATKVPFNQKTITRHYGFGTTAGNVALVGTDGKTYPLTNVSWSDLTITGNVPSGLPDCGISQQTQYRGSAAQCGELVITAANGKQSIDAVTVTIGGKAPIRVQAPATIQSAIDKAQPGDLIIVNPGVYNEMVLMWKPVRLQGVGAASSVINANTHPAGQAKMDPWRRQVVCLFGLAMNGTPITSTNPYDPSNSFTCSPEMQFSVDRLPLEAAVGWTAVLNGNLAEQLIEPSLMGAYEGAAITVLSKGVRFPTGSDPFASDVFPTGTALLRTADCNTNGTNPFPSNFWCNPSSIDGLSITNSSQGGGGIDVHGWGHNIQIANNRIHNNQGTLSGGITIGQGEHPDVYLGNTAPTTIPGSCESSTITNQSLPFCFDMNVNIHHNAVTRNSSLGDELFSSTPAGAGGVTLCNGSDYYKFNYNWVCGNMSTGDGGGVAHIGFTKNGHIEHNSILFNQSTNPTITTNGGGLLLMGAPDVDPPCGLTTDKDCVSPANTISPSDGTGPGLVVNANLIQGNSADSGSGGGLRLQHINGSDVLNFPDGHNACANPANASCLWNTVSITNNIIANNVAGWDGAGVSLLDALAVNIVNNTIVSNDATASSGALFGSLFAPLASTPVDPKTPGINCTTVTLEQSCPQVAGLVSVTNSEVLKANLPASGFTCPPGHGDDGSCRNYSVPLLDNDVIWQNRSFFIGISNFDPSKQSPTQNQQKVVKLYNAFTNTVTPSESTTGACVSASYWEIGVRGDKAPSDHSGGTLTPRFSVLTDAADYPSPAAPNRGDNPTVVSQYCNGSRVPPENGGMGWQVPPGTNESNALPAPVFTLTPSATVDEGNNWINISWGPLSTTNASLVAGSPSYGAPLGNYSLAAGSPAIDYVPNPGLTSSGVPPADFFGNPRPDPANPDGFDVGAVEFQLPPQPHAILTGGPLNFGSVLIGSSSAPLTLTLTNDGNAPLTGITLGFSPAVFSQSAGTCGVPPAALAAGSTCTITVVFKPTAMGLVPGSLTITGNGSVNGSPVALSGTGIVPAIASVTGGPLAFNNVITGTTSAAKTLTLNNTGGSTLTGITLTFSSTVYSRSTTSPGTCVLPNLLAGATCTINVVFSPTAIGAANGTLAITANVSVTGSPVNLTGTGILPALAVLDNFNRTNSNTLGGNWSQAIGSTPLVCNMLGLGAPPCAAIRVNSNQASNALGVLPGFAYWNAPGNNFFGSRQAAAFTFASTPRNNFALMLKATGATNALSGLQASFVRVLYTNGTGVITIQTTANNGATYTTVGATMTGFGNFALGDTLSAMVDQTGKVYVWKTTAANVTTYLGSRQLPATALWTTGGGRIGIQLPGVLVPGANGRVDNFAGGNVP